MKDKTRFENGKFVFNSGITDITIVFTPHEMFNEMGEVFYLGAKRIYVLNKKRVTFQPFESISREVQTRAANAFFKYMKSENRL